MQDQIEGRNPVLEALKSGRAIDKLLVRKGEKNGSLMPIMRLAKQQGIPVSEVERAKIELLAKTTGHQGVIAFCAEHEYSSVEAILRAAKEKGEPPFLVICDRITDPHNLGAIIRTANGAGAHGVIIGKHESAGLNATVAKTAAGAVEYTPVARVTNLVRTMEELKEAGVWIAGSDMNGEQSIYQADFKGGIAIVVGSEGEGMSRLVREHCDFMVSIPMKGRINSLNASVAAALMIYEVVRARETK